MDMDDENVDTMGMMDIVDMNVRTPLKYIEDENRIRNPVTVIFFKLKYPISILKYIFATGDFFLLRGDNPLPLPPF